LISEGFNFFNFIFSCPWVFMGTFL
jgi:hypothetical protein